MQGQPQKKFISLGVVRHQLLKYLNNISCVDQLCSVEHAPNIQTVAQILPIENQTGPNLTRLPTIISCYCQSSQEPQPDKGITSADEPKYSRVSKKNQESLGVVEPTILGGKTNQSDLNNLNNPHGRKIQNGDSRNIKDLPPYRRVDNVHRL